ncbi:hypothetical protein A3A76_03185 [Candidatus Woesebacteria bacterium RIFCSPLOWO2_01_FULL_39_23]|uniref:50S ribosomal protein L19 n=1 Tax=Candidatus Woesebacteria bacterium RIFCSPHIGHO2_01_FULL_40_22 TaxID=1802499 RepID=A0A1F7YLR7_9BACT|nr:MAG: hypothetical protein A2141_00840 [Candidatus Woesebacteria bacterium RBG_16_40_11]OGM27465.1 MAG: hypothetical protein A2628_01585 [Candidatus Woesebacteria bacterium RIFCSPHIGHO2_01_FULL_40_22]OGM36577.1 MAG: hypothetical protein A3E41_04060 [Candidatus Woesebacteria bacterium RIFCSPHIGHO2_12_FULL_38_9]OGM62639.1 MAG: hypothetical protein A3A76_03185 [Candidatus Woesebacteria bacterium RIFCSPLOWO2_01_FULL_39_23]
MSLTLKFGENMFGVGDKVKVYQRIKEANKERTQIFAGIVIKIKGDVDNKSFTVRRLGANQIGIERIFPAKSPTLTNVEVTKMGVKGVRKAKLYFIRNKSKKEIDLIYSRASKRQK